MKQLFVLLMMIGLSVFSVASYATESDTQLECAEADEQCLQQKQKQAKQEEEPECE